jgi:hypothetical protein
MASLGSTVVIWALDGVVTKSASAIINNACFIIAPIPCLCARLRMAHTSRQKWPKLMNLVDERTMNGRPPESYLRQSESWRAILPVRSFIHQ